jgi:hypothetical protein
MRRRCAIVPVLLPLLTTGVRALASSGEFSLREVTSETERINSFKRAFGVLDGQFPSSSEQTFADPYIDFTSPAAYAATLPDESQSSKAGHGFAVGMSGQVEIPTAGTWSFAVISRKNSLLAIDGHVIRAGGEGAHVHVKAITFSQPGTYTMSMTEFGRKTPSKLELYASPGKFHGLHGRGSKFELVGDAGDGGLALVGTSDSSGSGTVGSVGEGNTPPLVFGAGTSITTGTGTTQTGLLNTDSEDWQGGSTYDWKINDLSGKPGSGDGWDEISMSALTVSSVSSTNPVTIALQSLNGTVPGTPAGATDGPQSFVIAHSDSQVTINTTPQQPENLLDTGLFALDTSGFTVDNSPVPKSDFQLELVADGDGDNLQLNYTPSPEPGTTLLASAAIFPLLLARRRHSRAA